MYVRMYVLREVEVVSLNDTGIHHLGESLCSQIKLQRVKINLECYINNPKITENWKNKFWLHMKYR